MRIGRDPDCTWVTGGKKEAKETKIKECQITGVRLTRPLMVLDTHLPEIFSAESFSEFPAGKRRCRRSQTQAKFWMMSSHELATPADTSMTFENGWSVQIKPASRNRNAALTCAQYERDDGLCEIWQNWYNGCMDPDMFVEESKT